MEFQTLQNRAHMGPRGGYDGQKIEKTHGCNQKVGGGPQRCPILFEKVVNMGPTSLPKLSQNQ